MGIPRRRYAGNREQQLPFWRVTTLLPLRLLQGLRCIRKGIPWENDSESRFGYKQAALPKAALTGSQTNEK